MSELFKGCIKCFFLGMSHVYKVLGVCVHVVRVLSRFGPGWLRASPRRWSRAWWGSRSALGAFPESAPRFGSVTEGKPWAARTPPGGTVCLAAAAAAPGSILPGHRECPAQGGDLWEQADAGVFLDASIGKHAGGECPPPAPSTFCHAVRYLRRFHSWASGACPRPFRVTVGGRTGALCEGFGPGVKCP